MYIEKNKRRHKSLKLAKTKLNNKTEPKVNNNKEIKVNKTEPKLSKKNKIKYSIDGIPIHDLYKYKKPKKTEISNVINYDNNDLDIYNINDFSNIEEFSTDYKEEIWEYNLNNEKYDEKYNNLLFENNENENNNENINIDNNYLNDNNLINKIKDKLISNCYIKRENSLSDDMMIFLYKNLIQNKKILLL